jgi:hypothetical protein
MRNTTSRNRRIASLFLKNLFIITVGGVAIIAGPALALLGVAALFHHFGGLVALLVPVGIALLASATWATIDDVRNGRTP